MMLVGVFLCLIVLGLNELVILPLQMKICLK